MFAQSKTNWKSIPVVKALIFPIFYCFIIFLYFVKIWHYSMYRSQKYHARRNREYQEKERRHRMLSILYATLFSPISIVLDNDTFKVLLSYHIGAH